MIVGISKAPPFVDIGGENVTGFEIELWEEIARKNHINFEYKEFSFSKLLNAVKANKVDVGISAISRTRDREEYFNFSHYTLDTGLSIMVLKSRTHNFMRTFADFFKHSYRKIVALSVVLFISVLIFGNLIWLIEKDVGTFDAIYIKGVSEAFWWVVVTISSVGYGDFSPLTFAGRLLGTFVILFGLAFFAFFIAELSSMLTLAKQRFVIETYSDLKSKKVATKEGTTSVDALHNVKCDIVQTKEINDAVGLLREGKADAVVFDSHILLSIAKESKDLVTVGEVFAPQTYGFAFPIEQTELRDKVNVAILQLFETKTYDTIYEKWFGREG